MIIRELGVQPYELVWHEMQAFTNERDDKTTDQIWLLQHEPVFTLGQAGKREHLLTPGDIPIIETDRGGQVTYHGPGQLVMYLLLNLRRFKLGVRDLVNLVEHSVIDYLADCNISAQARADAPGVYVESSKIASLGLRIRRGCSFHGLSFNVAMDTEPFARINVCGYPGLQVTQLSEFVPGVTCERAAKGLLKHIQGKLGYTNALYLKGWD